MAYADDLVFFAKDLSEVKTILEKIESMSPYLEINKQKCGIMEIGDSKLNYTSSYLDLPVVFEYKYLGAWISPRTAEVVKKAFDSVKKFTFLLKSKVRSLPPEIAAHVMSSFVMGKLIYQTMPLYLAGVVKEEQIQQVYKNIICTCIGVSRSAENKELLEILGLGLLKRVCLKFKRNLNVTF